MPRRTTSTAKNPRTPKGMTTSRDARTTFSSDPDELPEFSNVVEAHVVEGEPMAPALPVPVALAPISMLDDQDELVQQVRDLLEYRPSTEAEWTAHAQRVQTCTMILIAQKRRIDMLLAEVAYYARTCHIWMYIGDHCQNEAQFWELCGTTMEKVNQMVGLRVQVVPMLHRAGIEDTVLEQVDAPTARALIKLARNDDTPPERLKEQITTLIEAPRSDLMAIQRLEQGLKEKQGIVLNFIPSITTDGKRFLRIEGIMDDESAQEFSARNTFWIYAIGGESVDQTRVYDQLQTWQPTTKAAAFDPDEDDMFLDPNLLEWAS